MQPRTRHDAWRLRRCKSLLSIRHLHRCPLHRPVLRGRQLLQPCGRLHHHLLLLALQQQYEMMLTSEGFEPAYKPSRPSECHSRDKHINSATGWVRTCFVHWGLPAGLQCPTAPHNQCISLSAFHCSAEYIAGAGKVSDGADVITAAILCMHRDMHSQVRKRCRVSSVARTSVDQPTEAGLPIILAHLGWALVHEHESQHRSIGCTWCAVAT